MMNSPQYMELVDRMSAIQELDGDKSFNSLFAAMAERNMRGNFEYGLASYIPVSKESLSMALCAFGKLVSSCREVFSSFATLRALLTVCQLVHIRF